MRVELQGDLFEVAAGPSEGADALPRPLAGAVRRTVLGDGAWVDARPGWLPASLADDLLGRMITEVDWRAERRQMYDRVVDVPRLTRFFGEHEPLPVPLLVELRELLGDHYADELGERFVSAGCCLYRDGRDSVAWHGDTTGRGSTHDTMVAIVSLGEVRTLALRPRGGGASTAFRLGHGDLVVMGGSCQRTWEHAVPKEPAAGGPRVSVQLRTRGVR